MITALSCGCAKVGMTNNYSRTSFLGVLLLALSACASLPGSREVEQKVTQQPLAALTVLHDGQLLDNQQAKAVLEQRLPEGELGDWLYKLLRAGEVASGNPLVTENQLKLLIDGQQTYESMFAELRQAKHHIHIETYILEDDEVGEQLAEILIDKAGSGVVVRLVFDAIGGITVDDSFYKRLREAGVQTQKFHPIDPAEDIRLWRINHRNHSKLVVVDGQTAFTGGLNISSVYSTASGTSSASGSTSGSFSRGSQSSLDAESLLSGKGWRDTHIRLRGPAVAFLQKRFMTTWERVAGEKLDNLPDYFPDMDDQGSGIVRVLDDTGSDGEFAIYELYISVLANAQQKVWITQAYFAPNKALIEALAAAARRGVDVRVMLPGVTDQGVVYHASRSHYGALLKAGVKIYEYQHRQLHAKTAVVDGYWATVGSANLDFRSFIHNDELNVTILDSSFAGQLEQQFQIDLKQSRAVTLEEWQSRPLSDRIKEFWSRRIEYWL